jgi:hypothetical protein
MTEMFERFMWFKQSEGLAHRTIEDSFSIVTGLS